MPSDLTTLARELVASPAWRGWQPRMRIVDAVGDVATVLLTHPSGGLLVHRDGAVSILTPVGRLTLEDCVPDLTDPATVGVLLSWLSDDWRTVRGKDWDGRPSCHVWHPAGHIFSGPTLGEAVARALIATSKETP